MSVPKYKRTPSKFEILIKCGAVVAHTIKMVSNEKIFPKRYRWCISNKIVDTLLDVMKNIQEANAIKVETRPDYQLRHNYQLKAATELRATFNLMEVAYNLFNIDDDKIDFWTGIMIELQATIKKWTDADTERHSALLG